MSRIFIAIYDIFERHKTLFYSVLVLSIALCAVFASQIRFDENISSFFGNGKDSQAQNAIFANFKAKDRIIVMVSGEDPDKIIEMADIFVENIQPMVDDGLILSITEGVDETLITKSADFVYDYLPIFLEESDYEQLVEKISDKGIDECVDNVYNLLTSPSGMMIRDVIMRDPLNIGSYLMKRFERFSSGLQYEIYGGRIFTPDYGTLVMFVEPAYGMGNTGNNEVLIKGFEKAASVAVGDADTNSIEFIGGPVVAVYNARQIKRDTALTLGIAVVIILLVILLSFRNRWSVSLIICPPAFGALFALAMTWLIQGSVSAIAIGACTVVLGISLSYSIHVISHLNHTTDPHQIINDLASPLTIGCMTTIGAFAALVFTSSPLLQDMGLFSVFALIGTTIFCLIFLPHFFKNYNNGRRSRFLETIEKGNSYSYESNKLIVVMIAVATIVGLFFFNDVQFDDDMSNLNYMPEHVVEAERRTKEILNDESKDVYLVSAADNMSALCERYSELSSVLDAYRQEQVIDDFFTVGDFVIPEEEQLERIDRWYRFWDGRREQTIEAIERNSVKHGFKPGVFSAFADLINRDFEVCSYSGEVMNDVPVLSDWFSSSGTMPTLMSRITISPQNKELVYNEINNRDLGTIVVDRAWFSSKMVENTNNDFNYILWVSSFIVFIALLISYGRIELALMTFLPMCVSWVIILGFMAMFGVKFNIVNIILATFIFGIGDDFSIFIMDGLIQEYKYGQNLLGAHKTAIFFSAFTAIVGMGVLIFAQHPALKSIALISVLGMSVVVLVSYTIQPLLFRLFVSSQTRKGGFPYTLLSILNTIYCFVYFFVGCIIIQLYIPILFILPMKRRVKKAYFHGLIYRFTRLFLATMFTVRTTRENPYSETFEKPAVIIANHQSFIDILLLLSVTPKIVMVTNSWVWNSPFFGWIVRYADFFHTSDGYEKLADILHERVDEGYLIVIFPEGTRSSDCRVGRFHKGAFYLAELLKLDIVPVLIYGTGQISAKTQGFYIKKGRIIARIMPRVGYGAQSFGLTYREQAKNYRRWFVEQYDIANDELGRSFNPYFRDALIKNYIYKGPVLEWYMRIKCRIDGYYDLWDRLLPRDAVVTDVGCGYGQMCFMLGSLSRARRVLGIDYDENKIAIAKNCFLCRDNIEFKCGDMRSVELPESDAFMFNDSLHYTDPSSQRYILQRALSHLNDGGMIVVRDGDSSDADKHDAIRQTEVWSTQIMKFNKTSESLAFVDSNWMQEFAAENDLDLRIRKCDGKTSETIYIFMRRI